MAVKASIWPLRWNAALKFKYLTKIKTCAILVPYGMYRWRATMKHTVSYTEKDKRKVLIEKTKEFPDVASACSFFSEIKGKSITIPIMDTVGEEGVYVGRITRN
jgi:hypothetical protein